MFRREEEEDYISLFSDMWRRKTIYHYVQTRGGEDYISLSLGMRRRKTIYHYNSVSFRNLCKGEIRIAEWAGEDLQKIIDHTPTKMSLLIW